MIDKVKLKVLNKLFDNGYCAEKQVINFNIEDITIIGCYTPGEITALIELKEAVKANKVISFLSGGGGKEPSGE